MRPKAWKESLLKLLLGFLYLFPVSWATQQDGVFEVRALLDLNVTLTCDISVADLDPEEVATPVLWTKIRDNTHEEVMVRNNHSTNINKYHVDYPNGVDILDLTLQDEGLYQCETDHVKARTILRVAGSNVLGLKATVSLLMSAFAACYTLIHGLN